MLANASTGQPDPNGPGSDHVDRDVDVAACGVGVRAHLVRGVHESLGSLAVNTRQTDVEASREAEDAMRRSQVDLGVNGHVSRERDLLLTGDELDRREKARRPTGREQLLGVGAGTRAAGRRKLDVEPAIVAVGGAAVPTTCGVRFRGIQDLFEGHDSLLVERLAYLKSASRRQTLRRL